MKISTVILTIILTISFTILTISVIPHSVPPLSFTAPSFALRMGGDLCKKYESVNACYSSFLKGWKSAIAADIIEASRGKENTENFYKFKKSFDALETVTKLLERHKNNTRR